MLIRSIVWRRNFFSQLRRGFLGIQSDALKKLRKDHALEWGERFENPGIWTNIIDSIGVRDSPTPITIENSHNDVVMWIGNNNVRGDKPKISQRIWEDKEDVIDTWYYFNFKLAERLMNKYSLVKNPLSSEEKSFWDFLKQRLLIIKDLNNVSQTELRVWTSETIKLLTDLNVKMDWFFKENFQDYNINLDRFCASSIIMVLQCVDNDQNIKYYTTIAYLEDLPNFITTSIDSTKNQGYITLKTININKQCLDIYNTLIKHKNVILYGPPGTGKTYIMNQIKELFDKGSPIYEVNIRNMEKPIVEILPSKQGNSKWCTFHQNYSYENFVVGIKPKVIRIGSSNAVVYENTIGPFIDIALKSSPKIWIKNANGELTSIANPGWKPSVLLIDEINRANTADVFGDLITILETNKRLGINGEADEVIPVTLNNEYQYMENTGLREFFMPQEMYILASMNSLDKSVAPLDAAFKRRFKIINIGPSSEALIEHYKLKKSDLWDENIDSNHKDYYRIFAYRLFETINSYIKYSKGEEFLIGHAYLWELEEGIKDEKQTLINIIRYKIYPYLKDIYSNSPEDILNLFREDNQNILYYNFESDFENIIRFKSIEQIDNEVLLSAYSKMVKIKYTMVQQNLPQLDFEEYQRNFIHEILKMLNYNRNCILYGPPGTGKTYVSNQISKLFQRKSYPYKWVTFHPSMGYEKFVIGIKPKLVNGSISYDVENGIVLDLCNQSINKNKLLVIDEINRGNTSEIFGELITLLEKDKRDILSLTLPYEYFRSDVLNNEVSMSSIVAEEKLYYNKGLTNEFSLPSNLFILGTMNSVDKSVSPLDSALKRRFYLIEMNPDYELLDLYFGTKDIVKLDWQAPNDRMLLKLSIEFLKALNVKIIKYKGEEYQFGHAYIWDLKQSTNIIFELASIMDNSIINVIKDMFTGDIDIMLEIFGSSSPLIKRIDNNFVDFYEMAELSSENKLLAFRGIMENENS